MDRSADTDGAVAVGQLLCLRGAFDPRDPAYERALRALHGRVCDAAYRACLAGAGAMPAHLAGEPLLAGAWRCGVERAGTEALLCWCRCGCRRARDGGQAKPGCIGCSVRWWAQGEAAGTAR